MPARQAVGVAEAGGGGRGGAVAVGGMTESRQISRRVAKRKRNPFLRTFIILVVHDFRFVDPVSADTYQDTASHSLHTLQQQSDMKKNKKTRTHKKENLTGQRSPWLLVSSSARPRVSSLPPPLLPPPPPPSSTLPAPHAIRAETAPTKAPRHHCPLLLPLPLPLPPGHPAAAPAGRREGEFNGDGDGGLYSVRTGRNIRLPAARLGDRRS